MRYRLKKDLPFAKEGIYEIVSVKWKTIQLANNSTWFSIGNSNLEDKEWFEKTIEWPKFKAWDCVVFNDYCSWWGISYLSYIKVYIVNNKRGNYYYNWIEEHELRVPTEEELKIYFN